MARQRLRKKPMAQINVVPFIDVMLVMLVVFMITAPLLNQGVEVNLPQASAEPIESEDQEPLIVSVDATGNYFINIGEKPESPVDEETLMTRVAAVLKYAPKKPVMVRGDEAVDYGKVVKAMTLLQAAGAPSVGLMTESPGGSRK
ncbi:MAG: protein TolR [Gammaproteobacteria bacterium]